MDKERIKTACPHCGDELDVTAYVEYGRKLAIENAFGTAPRA